MLCFAVSQDRILVKTFGQNQFDIDRGEWVFPTCEDKGIPLSVFRAAGIPDAKTDKLVCGPGRRVGSATLVLTEGFELCGSKFEGAKKAGKWTEQVLVLQGGYALVPISSLPEEMKSAAASAITLSGQVEALQRPTTRRVKKDAA